MTKTIVLACNLCDFVNIGKHNTEIAYKQRLWWSDSTNTIHICPRCLHLVYNALKIEEFVQEKELVVGWDSNIIKNDRRINFMNECMKEIPQGDNNDED